MEIPNDYGESLVDLASMSEKILSHKINFKFQNVIFQKICV